MVVEDRGGLSPITAPVVNQPTAATVVEDRGGLDPVTAPVAQHPTPAATSPVSSAPDDALASRAAAGVYDSPTPEQAAAMSDEEIDAFIRAEYGYLAWVLDHPELAPILRQAVKEGRDQTWVEQQLKTTTWWQTTEPARREWTLIQHEDPARAADMLRNVQLEIQLQAMRLGVPLSASRLRELASDAIGNGWVDPSSGAPIGSWLQRAILAEADYAPSTPAVAEVIRRPDGTHWLHVQQGSANSLHQITGTGQLRGATALYGPARDVAQNYQAAATIGLTVVDLFGGPGGIEEVVAGLRPDPIQDAAAAGDLQALAAAFQAMAAEWMVPLSDASAFDWAKRALMSETTREGFEAYLRQQAQGRFPHLGELIGQGVSPGRYFAPHREEIARLLEVTPDSVDLLDPQFSQVLEWVPAGGGERRPMTLYETQEFVRRLPQWRTTRGAQMQASQMAEGLAKLFGKVA